MVPSAAHDGNRVRTGRGARSDRAVTIRPSAPGAAELEQAAGALRKWQQERAPYQLHLGDER